jgi:hypothetical protein
VVQVIGEDTRVTFEESPAVRRHLSRYLHRIVEAARLPPERQLRADLVEILRR